MQKRQYWTHILRSPPFHYNHNEVCFFSQKNTRNTMNITYAKIKKKITEPIFHTTTTSGLFNLPSLCATKVGDEHLCRSIKRRQYMLPQTLTKLYILARIIIEICGIIIIITHLLIFQYIPCFVTTDFIVNHCTKLWSDSTLLIFENITFMETVFERL